MQEVWKPITGFECLYEVSNLGRVKSLPRIRKGVNRSGGVSFRCYKGSVLSTTKNNSRYVTVTLFKDGEETPALVHRLVAQEFLPNPENKPEVNHKDGDTFNNAVSNLEWCTRKENAIHSTKVLRKNIVEKQPQSKLTEPQVLEIVALSKKNLTQTEIGEAYGVDRTTIGKILSGKHWSHVTGIRKEICQ